MWKLQEGENDFIFIHLPRPPSADTSNRALSISYWLILIHYPGLTLTTLLPTTTTPSPLHPFNPPYLHPRLPAECQSLLKQNVRAHQAMKAPGPLLPLLTLPRLAEPFPSLGCLFLHPTPRNTTSPPWSCGNDSLVMALKTPNGIKYKAASSPIFSKAFPLFGLDVQQSIRQQLHHY